MDSERLLALDVETTSSDRRQARVVSYCFLHVDQELNVLGQASGMVNPGMPIPAEATEVHGITDDMVADALPFQKIAPRIQSFVDGASFIGHNLGYDLAVMSYEMERAGRPGIPRNARRFDTYLIEALAYPRNLGATYKRYTGKDLDGWHEARADVQASLEVLRHQLQAHRDLFPGGLADADERHVRAAMDPKAKEFLDHSDRFYRRSGDKVVRFGFGKFRDDEIAAHPDYLTWLLRQPGQPLDVQRIAQDALASSA